VLFWRLLRHPQQGTAPRFMTKSQISLPVNNVLTLRVSACNMHFEPLADRGGVYGEPRVTGKASEVPPPTTG
jgi:hypothetical protein